MVGHGGAQYCLKYVSDFSDSTWEALPSLQSGWGTEVGKKVWGEEGGEGVGTEISYVQ